MKIRAIPAVIALALAITLVPALAYTKMDQAERPTVIAVKFHADWCGSCKVIAPAFVDLANKYDGEPVLFVTFDLTNRTTTAQAEYLAAALGLSKVWSKHAPKTGYVLLIDTQTNKVVDTLTRAPFPRCAIAWATPRTTDDLPTPGSPTTSTERLRSRCSSTRCTSSSRKSTVASLPSRAAATRSRPSCSRAPSYIPIPQGGRDCRPTRVVPWRTLGGPPGRGDATR